MRRVAVPAALRFAAALVVLDQATAQRAPFVLNDEQRIVLGLLAAHRRVVVLKGRQVGISTVCCLFDLLFAIVNPGASVAIVADTEDKAKGLLKKVRLWARGIGVPMNVENEKSIELVNGASIDALSAVSHAEEGQSRTGRSKSYACIHCSELAFWGNDKATFGALTSSASPEAKVIIESTASPAENLFRTIWDRATKPPANDDAEAADDGWVPVFLSVEQHVAYRAREESITDERWAALQSEYGFTRRDSAAWWWRKLQVDFSGDTHACLREFPIVPAHAFAFAEGRWIFGFTAAVTTKDGPWERYVVAPEYVGEPVILGVDTGHGMGLDASTIAVVGQRSGHIHETFKLNSDDPVAFTETIKATCKRHGARMLTAVIEENGVGEAVWLIMRLSGWPVTKQHSDNRGGVVTGEKAIRMRRLKGAIESGETPIGADLQHEVAHSVRTKPKKVDKDGGWEGPDDLLNAVSFALKWRSENMPATGKPAYGGDDRNRLRPLPRKGGSARG